MTPTEKRNRLRSMEAHATLQLGAREPNAFGPGLDDLFRMRAIARPEVAAWSAGTRHAALVARQRVVDARHLRRLLLRTGCLRRDDNRSRQVERFARSQRRWGRNQEGHGHGRQSQYSQTLAVHGAPASSSGFFLE